jgi:uncharacterized SAM-binding protein YcdF (DUF218 family)
MRFIRRFCCVSGFCCLILLLLIHFSPLTIWWARALADDWDDSKGDTLIVLSSEIEADGVLGPSSYLRALYAVRAWREHPYRSIIVSGGRSGAAPVTMGEAFREFLVSNGVPAGIVHAENAATNTRENALFTKPLIGAGAGRIVLLTSDFHMFRARRVFEKAGIHVVPCPVPDVLKRSAHVVNRWTSFWTLLIETTKIGYYSWKRWL